MKKLISILLVTFMLLSSFSIVGNAYYDIQIFEGDVILGSLYDENEGTIEVYFIPEETGYYRFFSMGNDSPICSIMDGNFKYITGASYEKGKNFSVECYMTAGETYYLYSSIYWGEGSGEYSVSIERTEVNFADEVFIYHGGNTTAYPGDNRDFECFAGTEGEYIGTCTWEVSPFWMANVSNAYDSKCRLFFFQEGTVTLKVTTSTGLSDSIEITCVSPPQLKLDEKQTVSFGNEGGVRKFKFTPDEYGYFALCTEGNTNAEVIIHEPQSTELRLSYSYDENGELVQKGRMDPTEVYEIEVKCSGESPDFDIYMTKCPPAESLSIEADWVLYGYVGERISLHQIFYPATSMGESVTWHSSDENVAERGYNETTCDIDFKSVGSSVITCVSESGFTASVTVKCLEKEKISTGETKEVLGREKKVFSFKPEKDGYYTFYSEGGSYTSVAFVDDWWYDITERYVSYDGMNERGFAYLYAGREYSLWAYDTKLPADETYTVTIKRATLSKKLMFEADEEIYARVGETLILPFRYDSKDAVFEYVNEYSSNWDIIDITVHETYLEVYCKGEGVTCATIVSERNLMANCDIYISPVEYTPLTENKNVSVEKDKYEFAYFSFTAERDGRYAFLSEGSFDTYVEFIDEKLNVKDFDEDGGSSNNFSICFDAEAGKTYYFRAYVEGENSKYDAKIVECVQATSMMISGGSYICGKAGEVIEVTTEFGPVGGASEAVSWRSDDKNVFIAETCDGERYGWIYLVGEGTAVLSAYSDSGLYAEITVVVCGKVNPGDVNEDGAVNSIDSNLIKRYLSGSGKDIAFQNADMNGDGNIDSRDSNLMKRLLAGQ